MALEYFFHYSLQLNIEILYTKSYQNFEASDF